MPQPTNNNQRQTIGDILKALREDLGWTLEEVAGKAGIVRATLSAIEKGKVMPHFSTAAALARVYGISLDSLAKHMVVEIPCGRCETLIRVFQKMYAKEML